MRLGSSRLQQTIMPSALELFQASDKDTMYNTYIEAQIETGMIR